MRKHRNHSSNERSHDYARSSQGQGQRTQQPRDPRTGEFTERGRGFSGSQDFGNDARWGSEQRWPQGAYGSEGPARSSDEQDRGSWSDGSGFGRSGGYQERSPRYGNSGSGQPGWSSARGPEGRMSNGYGEMNWEGDEFESRNAGFRGGSGSDWSSEGRYAGRGPKGYTRSDERIKEEISDALTAHGGIDASECTVQVSDGEVTLEGEVETREMKRAVEDVAEACSGVKQVHNRLRIAKSGNGHDSNRSSRSPGLSSSEGERMEGSSSKKGSPSARS
jgi:osmotically-inducible protein OsmY